VQTPHAQADHDRVARRLHLDLLDRYGQAEFARDDCSPIVDSRRWRAARQFDGDGRSNAEMRE